MSSKAFAAALWARPPAAHVRGVSTPARQSAPASDATSGRIYKRAARTFAATLSQPPRFALTRLAPRP